MVIKPDFLAFMGYHIFLTMVLREKRAWSSALMLYFINDELSYFKEVIITRSTNTATQVIALSVNIKLRHVSNNRRKI